MEKGATYFATTNDQLSPYPAYKNSGSDWLGDLPEHWEVRAIKTLLREKPRADHGGELPLLSLTRQKGLTLHSDEFDRPPSAIDLSNYNLCEPGDLVMNRMQAWSGMFAVASICGLVSPDYRVFSPRVDNSVNVSFFAKLFKTRSYVDQFAIRSKGVGSGFNRLYTLDFGAIPVATPPIREQQKIAQFLDYFDQRIQRFINTKQKLIELLKEQKQATIHQAVTGKIDIRTGEPYPAYKDSDVEWLRELPEHWNEWRLTTAIRRMESGSREQGPAGESGVIPNLGGEHIGANHRLKLANLRFVSRRFFSRMRSGIVQPGDILLVKDGATIGKVAHVEEMPFRRLSVNEHVYLIRTNNRVAPRYVFHILCHSRVLEHIWLNVTGSAQPGLNKSFVKTIRAPFPPLVEQQEIARYVDVKATAINRLIDITRRQVDLLIDYRTRLIADVVTGKIDVRHVAARLPKIDPLNSAVDQPPGNSSIARTTEGAIQSPA